MSRLGRSIVAAATAALLAAPAAAAAPERPALDAPPPSPPRILSPDRVIVEWAPAASRAARRAARAKADVAFAADLGSRRFQLVETEPGQAPGQAVRELEADPAVRLAERDGYDAPTAIPDDPLFGQLWGLRNTGAGIAGFAGAVAGADIGATEAWNATVGDPAVVVADIDSGYRFEHPDLAAVAWTNPGEELDGVDDDENGIVDDVHGADFVGEDAEAPQVDGDPTDGDLLSGGHGVHTAGTIGAAGDNGIGITGVAQDIRIMPLRVCSRFPQEEESLCPFSAEIEAINYAGAMGARVANMSLGGTFDAEAVGNAIAANPETLFVISAGNDGEDNDAVPHYPCNYDPPGEGTGAVDNVICVAATDQADELAGFSDWGASSVDLGAPGTETLSTFPVRAFLAEGFEADDFASRWLPSGTSGGFARTDEPPLASFGMSDSPGAAPAPGSVRASTSAPVPVPPGFRDCALEQTRTLSADGSFRYEVRLDGSEVASSAGSPGAGRFALSLGDDLIGGGELTVRFRYTAGASPGLGSGVWLDEIDLYCTEPVGEASGYAFLQGTSMAAPHVSGGAALLFSAEPAATVTEVRDALLAGVDPVPSLAGKTASGGRLDVAKALESLTGTEIVEKPAPPPPFEPVEEGGTVPSPIPVAPTVSSPNAGPAPKPTGAPAAPAATCRVPRLAGRTLARAKAALRRAGCRPGRVVKRRPKRGRRARRLVVRSSAPAAGTVVAAGSRVNLRLAPKPKPRSRSRSRKAHR